MSTSCTSAALATTTSGSTSLARNTAGAGCTASLYASIDLHSDDAGLRSGEEDKTIMENAPKDCSILTPMLQHHISELPISMSMAAAMSAAAASTRRNKRKNFQPRNIKPSDSPDGSADNEKNSDELAGGGGCSVDGNADLVATADSSACCSISESKITMISSHHSDNGQATTARKRRRSKSLDCDVADESNHDAEETSNSHNSQVNSDGELNSYRNESRNSSRSSSRSSSLRGSRRKSAAVDLRLRQAYGLAQGDEDDDNDDDDGDNSMAKVSNLEMKTWMLFWQKQQSCNDGNFKGNGPPFPPMTTAAKKQSLMRQPQSDDVVTAVSDNRCDLPAHVDLSAFSEYAQNTMRELLGYYGLQRDSSVPINLPPGVYASERAGSPVGPCHSSSEGQARSSDNATGAAALRSSSTPSGQQQQQQPPTPPHTPKTSNATSGQPTGLSLGRSVDYSCGVSDPSLMALQSHMHSLLTNSRQSSSLNQLRNSAGSPSGGADLESASDAPSEVQHRQQGQLTNTADGRSVKTGSGSTGSAAAGRGGGGSGSGGSGSKSSAPIDYSRYVKRFGSAAECGSPYCRDLNYREHFHCLDCNPRVFVKKEEMIRHFKWHKKRDESLQHGFMRYSPGDDCNDRYRGCPHNRKQTHYHCVKDGCDKVYISTSDVQMHANYHRKDSAIIQEGFQRFRATEDCATAHCAFNGQRTTHFHCRRSPCNYTFKNKADMEKHKSYHIKDEQLARDGFKKFMKNEACQFDSCRFSRVCNHIHCIREGCTYVLHSSGQLYSHKRKHERRDAELAYQDGASTSNNLAAIGNTDSTGSGSNSLGNNPMSGFSSAALTTPSSLATSDDVQRSAPVGLLASDLGRLIGDPSLTALLYGQMPSLLNQLEMAHLQHRQRVEQEQQQQQQRHRMLAAESNNQRKHSMSVVSGRGQARSPSPVMSEEDAFRLCLARVEAGKTCQSDCQAYPNEHYHCRSDGCALTFKSTEAAKEHWRNHEHQEQISDNYYISVEVDEQPNPCPASCPYQTRLRHYHCCWEGCTEIILSTDKPFRRLDHYNAHEYSRRGQLTPSTSGSVPLTPVALTSSAHSSAPCSSKEITFTTGSPTSTSFSLDSMFRRKRGRPPKNRVIEVWNESSQANPGSGLSDTPQAIFTSFKLPKPTTPPLGPYSSATGMGSGLFAPPVYTAPMGLVPSHSASSSRSSSSGEWKSQRTLSPSPERVGDMRHGTNHVRKSAVSDGRVPNAIFKQKRNGSPSGLLPPPPPPPPIPPSASLRSPDSSPAKSTTVVKAAGTFYPSAAFPTKSEGSRSLAAPSSLPISVPITVSTSAQREASSSTSPTPIAPQNSSFSNHSSSVSPASSSSSTSPTPLAVSSPSAAAHTSAAASTAPASVPSGTGEKPLAYGPDQSCGRPFCKLKRREHYHCVVCNQAFSEMDKLKPHMLKHCTGALSPTLSQWTGSGGLRMTSDPSAIAAAAVAASGASPDCRTEAIGAKEVDVKKEMDLSRLSLFGSAAGLNTSSLLQTDAGLCDMASRSSAAALHALTFMSPLGSPYGLVAPNHPNGTSSSFLGAGLQPLYAGSGLLLGHSLGSGAFSRPNSPGKPMSTAPSSKRPSSSPVDQLMLSPDAKKMRFQSSMRLLKDEPVPQGYVRFRFNEDCQYPLCGYREHQTHFHCMRQDCGYSFCDKTRFVQHTARHERLDTLMGGDFQQYRANVGCGRAGCLYTASLGTVQNKASHFHCLKCDFVCTDTNKVVAHRRQHQKTDSILAAGFEKFTPSQNCHVDSCAHSNKQTHYHCLKCCYAVLGLAQMSAHKYRHLESTTP